MSGAPREREEGVVLLLVLVIIVLSISSVWAFARTSALDVLGMRNRADRGRATLLARSGVDVAIRTLKDDLQKPAGDQQIETYQDPWFLIGESELELPDQGRLRIHVRDMGGKINLNGLVDARLKPHAESRDFLTLAMRQIVDDIPVRKEDKPYNPAKLADAVLDWIDLDKRTRLGELELAYYGKAGARAVPPNRPFFSVAELGDLPGVDARLLEALGHYFTVYPVFADLSESGINPNTAPGWALRLIYMGTADRRDMIDYRDVLRALRERAEGKIFCPVSEAEPCMNFHDLIGQVGETAFPPLSFYNRAFEIESVAHYREARACVSSIVERRGTHDVRTLAYEQQC